MSIEGLIALCLVTILSCNQIVRYWIRYSHQKQIMDTPNYRSAHKFPTPTSGGIGIALSTSIIFFVSLILVFHSYLGLFVYVVIGGLLAAIGFFDDQESLPIQLRLAAFFACSLVMIFIVGTVDHIYLPFFGDIAIATIISVLALLVWLVGFTNMFNFMDGIDGIASTQAILTTIGWLAILLPQSEWELSTLATLILGSCLGFLFWNWSPAKIFMGDVGSLFLGFTLAVFPLLAYKQLDNPRILVVGVMFVFPFLFDATLTILRRARNGENVLASHFSHLYQRLVTRKKTHSFVTKIYGMLGTMSVISGLIYFYASYDFILLLSLSFVVLIHLVFFLYVTRIERLTLISARNSS